MKKNELMPLLISLLFIPGSGFVFTLCFRLIWNLTPATASLHIMSIGDGVGIFLLCCILLIPVIVLAGWILVHMVLEAKK